MTKEQQHYQSGFGCYWQSEALPNALPVGQNSPQQTPYGLFAEQLSGSAFTRPRHLNYRSWLYRILPSVAHSEFKPYSAYSLNLDAKLLPRPTQLRWDPLKSPTEKTDFIHGLKALLYNGQPNHQQGGAIYLYAANDSMLDSYFYNSDGELLFVPYHGECELWTEFGKMSLKPCEIAVIPRGCQFQVRLLTDDVKGYLLENYGHPFILPDLGPIGSNGLANPRDFCVPHAFYEEKSGNFTLLTKYQNQLWQANINHSALNVVAWHGNYAPYKYDLKLFNTINTVSFDHCDPSIFTVLTSPSAHVGVANIDFVIFPERWMVAEHTFRPPYYHRNLMSEYMGLIQGVYDAKVNDFVVGGSSLHNCMSAHGPDELTYLQALKDPLNPTKLRDTLAFMFESALPWAPTEFALSLLQDNYQDCWQNIQSTFDKHWLKTKSPD